MRPRLHVPAQWRSIIRRQQSFRAAFSSASSSFSRPLPAQAQHHRDLLTLAIETSCDDTCVAILSKKVPAGRAILHFNRKVTSDCTPYGGVYPPAALRGHDASLAPLIAESLASLPPAVDEGLCTGPGGASTDAAVVAAVAATAAQDTIMVSGVARQKPSFVTVTRGPGMPANLALGLATAKGLAAAWQVPLVAVNHMQAHALTPRLVSALEKQKENENGSESSSSSSSSNRPEFPFLTLLVSGGHTQLVHSRSLTDHRILANSNNIAVGDALDKAARHVLPPEMVASHTDVMYGALLERFAFPDSFLPSSSSPPSGDSHDYDYDYEYSPPLRRRDEVAPYAAPAPYTWSLTPPLATSRAMSYDFNGIGSEIRKIAVGCGTTTTAPAEQRPDRGQSMPLEERRLLARATMRLLFEHLASRVFLALSADRALAQDLETLVVSGGVASNRFLMHVLRRGLDARGFARVRLAVPPPSLCTDNAAMIAWTGLEMYEAGWETDFAVSPARKWSVDPASEDGGIMGIGGWVRREKER